MLDNHKTDELFSALQHLRYNKHEVILFHVTDHALEREFQLVEVPDEEYDSLGCNVLAAAPRQCVMLNGNPITQKRLEKAGAKVWTYTGQDISFKGTGGPTCLTRPIWRAG